MTAHRVSITRSGAVIDRPYRRPAAIQIIRSVAVKGERTRTLERYAVIDEQVTILCCV